MQKAAVSLCLALLLAAGAAPAAADGPSPFDKLAGRWSGEGRLGMKEGKTEIVKCRATYFIEGDGNHLRQNVRCASSSGMKAMVLSYSDMPSSKMATIG